MDRHSFRQRQVMGAAAGGVLIAASVPVLLVEAFAGVFLDRWNVRRTMLAADAVRAVLIAALVALPLLPAGALPVAAQLAIVYGVGLTGPRRRAATRCRYEW